MNEAIFNLGKLFVEDKSSSFALQPFAMSFIEECEAMGMKDVIADKFSRDVKDGITSMFGGYESHFEGDIEHVHGVRLSDWFYANYPQNSIGHIEHELSLWYSEEIGSDKSLGDYFRTPFGCGYEIGDDGIMDIYNFSLKSGCGVKYQWPSIPSGILNGYLLEKYRCFVSVVFGTNDKGRLGFNYMMTQSKDNGGAPDIVRGAEIGDGMVSEYCYTSCRSEMGAYSLAFSVLRDRIIESKLVF